MGCSAKSEVYTEIHAGMEGHFSLFIYMEELQESRVAEERN